MENSHRCQWSTGPLIGEFCGSTALFAFMFILEEYMQRHVGNYCNPDLNEIYNIPENKIYDYIIVGGGTSGAVLASRLSENPKWNVLLIEQGYNEPTAAQIPSMQSKLYNSRLITTTFNVTGGKSACLSTGGYCSWTRGKTLGGTSVVNDMMYIRGDPEDYNAWAANGNTGWSYEDVLPYFKLSENNLQINEKNNTYHSAQGLLPVSTFPYEYVLEYDLSTAAEEFGIPTRDLNEGNSTGFMKVQSTSKQGIRYSTARAFLGTINNRPNLHVLLRTNVKKILINPKHKIAYGVKLNDDRVVKAKKEVIVSAGPINSPKLLLLSGVGPMKHLKKVKVPVVQHLPGVGRNLQDHVSVALDFVQNYSVDNPMNIKSVMEYLVLNSGPLATPGISQLTLKYATKLADNASLADIQLLFRGYDATCSKAGGMDEKIARPNIQFIPVLLRPKSRGYIKLASNKYNVDPLIYANYFKNKHDAEVLVEGAKFALNLSDSSPLHHLLLEFSPDSDKCDFDDKNMDEFFDCLIKENTLSQNHQAGTCKMGPAEDKYAVVDHTLRVHKIRHLRVVDASIMPTITSGNTHAPTIMIAEKAADMIRKYWTAKKNI